MREIIEGKGVLNNFLSEFFMEKLNNIGIPTHFIKGGNSNYITTEDEIIINKHFSNFSIATIDRAGHWIHAEAPERFYNEVMKFCLM